ncbi:hypothetical protein RXV86_12800 [Alisedimentitalea sp. MJ-SS2]|uniref:hypothetical protein n=1 Tax=Aliisedimentitalea sp. MJ-SS2 TaxID=3049795 RepID=UPI002914C92F|nr:hypothetical protein [Alisedimentitalea sp. MJ-SS2]MDU8928267.1 hypothetical protein [Alisedimentitalea sp. MJ-SS2]
MATILVACSVFVGIGFVADFLLGGHQYKQGDWLINTLNQPVRRGPMGSTLIWLSDQMGVGLLEITILVQLGLYLILPITYWRLARRADFAPSALLLALSPAMYFLLWAAVAGAAARKEIFAIAALLLIGLYIVERRSWLLVSATVLLAVGAWGHLVNVMVLPIAAAVLAMPIVLQASHLREPAEVRGFARLDMAALVFLATNGGVATLYAIVYSSVPSVSAICAPLLERGLGPEICDGAISWLTLNSAKGAPLVADRYSSYSHLTRSFLMMFFGFLPLGYLLARLPKEAFQAPLTRGRAIAIIAALSLPILPLYLVAEDWERWIAFHVFCATVFFLLSLHLDLIRLSPRLERQIL